MLATSLTFASPAGAVLCGIALVPLGVLAVTLGRNRRAASVLGLAPAGSRPALPAAIAAAGACALLGIAAAQPVLQTTESRRLRTESEVMFVVDVSRSMAAARDAGAPSRLERARAAVRRLREAVPEVPAGISGLTDRVLPYLFATPDKQVFAETLRRSVGIQTPRPQQIAPVATSFSALPALADNGFFSRGAERRTCVVVTDGESVPFSAAEVGGKLRGPRGCRLVVVQVWSAGERVFRPDGTPEANYRPAADARSNVDRLAAAARGSAFAEDQLDAAVDVLRSAAVAGPEAGSTEVSGQRALAPGLAAAALLLAIGLAVARLATRGWRNETSVYHPVPEP